MWSDGWARNLWWGGAPPEPAQFAQLDAVHTTGSSFSLVRAEVFDAADGLDEGLHPGYFVDVTLGMAIRRQGRAVLLDPRARAVHHKSSSTSAAYREFLVRRNHARFCARWGDDLRDHHEPFVDNPESYRAAHERARTQAARAKRERRWEVSPPPRRLRVDPLAQERSLLETEHRVYKADDEPRTMAEHQALAKEYDGAGGRRDSCHSAVHEVKKVRQSSEPDEERQARSRLADLADAANRAAAASRDAGQAWRLLPLLRVLSAGCAAAARCLASLTAAHSSNDRRLVGISRYLSGAAINGIVKLTATHGQRVAIAFARRISSSAAIVRQLRQPPWVIIRPS
jgi:hypothetical protein